MSAGDTIAAIATPPGTGGIGIVRISGPDVAAIARQVIGALPPPRQSVCRHFSSAQGEAIDEGIALYFPAPRSFTGEDVLELQGHGGAVVMDLLMERVLQCGARVAHPGEFSKRAFLNGKLDLTQAEAIADLIEAGTATAARLAMRSLDGAFSEQINQLSERITHLRLQVEAAIDFPDEELDLQTHAQWTEENRALLGVLDGIFRAAQNGRLLREGLHLVIAGPPNVGKSSLLNALAGRESAIVTAIPGTTRDLLHEQIAIEGMPLHLVDTAGLRTSEDPIEREGMRRAREELARADHILWLIDERDYRSGGQPATPTEIQGDTPLTLVRNKIDLVGEEDERACTPSDQPMEQLRISVKTGEGMDALRRHLREFGGCGDSSGEFIARRRHLEALEQTRSRLCQGFEQFQQSGATELLAEELRLAQQALGAITGRFSADDLLGEIFGQFCIGK